MSELQPDDSGASPVQAPGLKTRRALSGVKRELSEQELATPGIQKMLIEELERVEEEIIFLKVFRERYYEKSVMVEVLKEKQKSWTSNEIISTACIAVGAAALVYGAEVWKEPAGAGAFAVVFGGVLTGAGILAKRIVLK